MMKIKHMMTRELETELVRLRGVAVKTDGQSKRLTDVSNALGKVGR